MTFKLIGQIKDKTGMFSENNRTVLGIFWRIVTDWYFLYTFSTGANCSDFLWKQKSIFTPEVYHFSFPLNGKQRLISQDNDKQRLNFNYKDFRFKWWISNLQKFWTVGSYAFRSFLEARRTVLGCKKRTQKLALKIAINNFCKQ